MTRERATPQATVIPLPTRSSWNPEAIVAGLKANETEAGAALYARVGPRVNRLVWRLLGADRDHDDVVHQVFVNAFQSIGRLQQAQMLDAWITGITINTVRRELRTRTLRRRFFGADSPAEPISAESDPHRALVAKRFYQLLATLPSDQRIIYCLRYLEDLTLPEIASMCGCSLATCKRRLRSATDELQRLAQREPLLHGYLSGERDDHEAS